MDFEKYSELDLLKRLTEISGLGHDLGKASINFQNKLRRSGEKLGENIRHEWLSMRLIEELILLIPSTEPKLDEAWEWWEKSWESLRQHWNIKHNTDPRADERFHHFKTRDKTLLAPTTLEGALLINVATHHKLFGGSENDLQTSRHTNRVATKDVSSSEFRDWCYFNQTQRWTEIDKEKMSEVLCKFHKNWTILKTHEEKISLKNQEEFWQGMSYVSRAALIVADQFVSSMKFNSDLKNVQIEQYGEECEKDGVSANQIGGHKGFMPNQSLPEHLLRVAEYGSSWVENFFTQSFDVMQKESHANLRKFNLQAPEAFRWQEYAVKKLLDVKQPCLVMNMASTGSGKTRMNVRALAALNSLEKGMRCAAVFNLKTLTLQTRDSVINELNIPSSDVACVIGDKNAMALHNNPMLQDDYSEDDGGCFEMDFVTIVDAKNHDGPSWIKDMSEIKSNLDGLISKPFLISTIDYVVNAGDPSRHIDHGLCLLRIANSDLILDEIDSYDPYAVAAVLRVVKMSAYFGRNVVVSSATLPESIALSIWKSFYSGLKWRGTQNSSNTALLDNVNDDTQSCIVQSIQNEDEFIRFYLGAVDAKIRRLDVSPVLRRAEVVGGQQWAPGICREDSECGNNKKDKAIKEVSKQIGESIRYLHDNNAFQMSKDGVIKNVSFGLVRVANVIPAVSLAKEFVKNGIENTDVYVCPYHATDIMLRRKLKEAGLDENLKRGTGWVKNIEKRLSKEIFQSENKNVIFLVIATPVEEVGRDHDFDWAVIEPSSIASIVQTAGRINRHRKDVLKDNQVNIHILRYNIRALAGMYPAFCYPGNEVKDGSPYKHNYNLDHLLNSNGVPFPIDARLVFKKKDGHRGCDLAYCDELSLKKILDKVQCLIDGKSEADLHFSWLSQKFHLTYVLREKSQQSHMRFHYHDGTWSVQKLEWQRDGFKNNQKWVMFKDGVKVNACVGKGFWWLSEEFDEVYKKAKKIDTVERSNLVEEGFVFTLLNHQIPKDGAGKLGFHWRAGGYTNQNKGGAT